MRKLLNLLVLLALSGPAFSQMLVGTDTLYGNEWINYDQSYYKISVAQDGIYKITRSDLDAAGIPNSVNGNEFKLFSGGIEVPIYVSNNNTLGASDYIEFYGVKNRGDLDQFL